MTFTVARCGSSLDTRGWPGSPNASPGFVTVEDDTLWIDLDHLAQVVAAAPRYRAAWDEYERRCRPPADDTAWEAWRAAGPVAGEYAIGPSDFLVMSSGELGSVRLLATLSGRPAQFNAAELSSLESEGAWLLSDWCRAVRAVSGHPLERPSGARPEIGDRHHDVVRTDETTPAFSHPELP